MSPALQKLRKDLDSAKTRHPKPAVTAAPVKAPVEWDAIELLFAAIVAQDAEIRKLKADRNAVDEHVTGGLVTGDAGTTHAASADEYVGHIEEPAHPAVYSLKKPKPLQTTPPPSGD